jgi:cell division protein FtsW (lipid II flippase)
MITVITVAPILFLICVAVGVAVMNRARRDLTVQQKAVIFDAAPKRQSWLLVAMALVMAAYTLPTLHTHSMSRWSLVTFSAVVYVLVLVPTAVYMRRLSTPALRRATFARCGLACGSSGSLHFCFLPLLTSACGG